MLSKDIVFGLGEIGNPIYKILSKVVLTAGFDINPKLMNQKKFDKLRKEQTEFAHICIPFSKKFDNIVMNIVKKYKPKAIVIHSTIAPYTTKKIQKSMPIPVIFSATRGVHKRMLSDLKRYTKFFAIENDAPKKKWAISTYSKLLKKCRVKTRLKIKQMGRR